MMDLMKKRAFIIDMDGVIYHGHKLLAGSKEMVHWLHREEKRFLFLTNSSERSPRELSQKLKHMGMEVSEDHFYTSALATASFLHSQQPGGTAFVIGEAGLTNALYEAGFTMNDTNPDYVVVGETRSYGYERIEQAINLVSRGAKLIGTNPDLTGPGERGILPATGALISPIELATRRKAYFVGKPNPLMMRHALKELNSRREDTIIIGDRMDTDIISGIEADIETVLVLSGVTSLDELKHFAYSPNHVFDSIADLLPG